jgi:ubiquinone/menaquinone biosynthesis C-methylase UbiE
MIEEIQSEQADIATSMDNYTSRFSGKVGEYFLELQKKITLDFLKDENIKTVLDVGGGHAQLAVPLVKEGYNVTITGSNISCRNRLDKFLDQSEFKFIECNFLNLPFESNSFDAVVCFRLLTHEKNWTLLVKEMCRVSKKVIVIDYPDIRSFNIFSKILFGLKKKIEKNTRTFKSFSRKELKKEFEKYDFKYFIFRPQYFLPMVIYRILKNVEILKISEFIFQITGLQYLLGTPVILKVKKQ